MKETDLKAQFQKVDDNLNDTYEKNDVEDISKLLSDDWTILESSTGLSSKIQFLKAIKDGNLSHSSMKKEVVQTKLDNDIAVVISKGKNVGRYLDKTFNSEQWITNLYKKENSQWICIMTVETPVSD